MSLLLEQLDNTKSLQEHKKTIKDATDRFRPYSKHLENTDKIGVRTMAEGREGYVRLVSRIAQQHDDTLAKTDNSQDLVNRLQYNDALDDIRIAIMEYLETITDTQFANSADIMAITDRYAASLESGRKNNSALDSAMKEIDDWNSRYGRDQTKPAASAPTPAAGGNTPAQ